MSDLEPLREHLPLIRELVNDHIKMISRELGNDYLSSFARISYDREYASSLAALQALDLIEGEK